MSAARATRDHRFPSWLKVMGFIVAMVVLVVTGYYVESEMERDVLEATGFLRWDGPDSDIRVVQLNPPPEQLLSVFQPNSDAKSAKYVGYVFATHFGSLMNTFGRRSAINAIDIAIRWSS